MNKKLFLSAFLTAVIVAWFVLIGGMRFGEVHAATNVTGIISTNTTWTKGNSPYNLTNSVTVVSGATLRIESGVTVFLNGYGIEVDGTLSARGTDNDPIRFDSIIANYHFIVGQISFSQSSTGWNEQAGSGCIIEDAVFNSTEHPGTYGYITINQASPKINQSSIEAAITVNGGSPIISGNIIATAELFTPAITTNEASPVISNNLVSGEINATGGDTLVISTNVISGGINLNGSTNAEISDNNVSGGISIDGGKPKIERNLITDAAVGVAIGGSSSPLIQNNTIVTNTVGLNIFGSSSPTIIYNNIQDNSQWNVYLGQLNVYGSTQGDVNATYNWWGTTDTQIINQTIYDHKNNFDLGTVTFVPFLTSLNPEIPEFSSWIILLIFMIATLLIAVVYFNKRKH
jgi:parallel beta-helix repeat protein